MPRRLRDGVWLAKRMIASNRIAGRSGALPCDTEYCWDGGIELNMPPQYLLDQQGERSSLAFQVEPFIAWMLVMTTRLQDIL